jgi:hypothetical protein
LELHCHLQTFPWEFSGDGWHPYPSSQR